MTLAYLHVKGCPCSRCRVSRNYARLLATVAASPEPAPTEDFATQLDIPLAETDGRNLHAVGHVSDDTPTIRQGLKERL